MMFRACDCFNHPCRHNPPKGMIAVKRKNHGGWWFVNRKMSWFEKFYRTKIQDYIL